MLRTLFLFVVLIGAVATAVALVAGVGLWRAAASVGAAVEAEQVAAAKAVEAKAVAAKLATRPATHPATSPASPATAPTAVVQNEPVIRPPDPVVLDVADAVVSGSNVKVEGTPKAAVNWKHPTDQLQWEVDLPRTGMYAVEAEYACGPDDGGGMMYLTVGQSRQRATVRPTAGWDDYRTVVLCHMYIPAGQMPVVLFPAFQLGEQTLMRLRRVKLTLVEEMPMEPRRSRRMRERGL